jgi:hypothetical protein
VICFNPEGAQRDQMVRERLVAVQTEKAVDTDRLSATKRAELSGVITTKPGLNRYPRVTAGGLLRVDQAAITAEERLDGKYLLRRSDPQPSAEDIALGHKQLLEVERGWRDLKTTLDLRPAYHRREDRIRAHILLCWLALLLIRIAETRTGHTWTTLRTEVERIHVAFHRHGRHLPPTHRTIPTPEDPPHHAQHRRAAPHPRRHPGNALTSPNPNA